MNTSIKNISKVLATAALLASAGFAHAAPAAPNGGSATANLAVSASITAKCTISTTAVAFGAYDPVVTNSSTGSNVTQNGEVVVACTKRAGSLWVGLGEGSNAVSGARNMVGAASTDKLAYSLVQPVANTVGAACPAFGAGTAWENTDSTALNLETSTGVATRTYKVCGEIAKGQDKSVDAYSDTVVATINF